mmetsp:Transcript_35870/g.95064  ORF Transcript_35870/g.95064 Transcript_35870/m.95064 type:complete len:388 (+) Transcript_35870:123-1286(+)
MGSNCMASASIGCLYCCQRCNAEKLRNAFTFLPPQASYAVEGFDASGFGKMVYLSETIKSYTFYQQAADLASVRMLRTSKDERIPVVWLRPNSSSSGTSPEQPGQQPLVLLHCHGNATDIGMMMGPYLELATQLACEVVGVEYTGYGSGTGAPSSANALADVEAAYDFVISQGVPSERIVAYGQSVGSGPVLALAASRPLGGVIVHSPMLSGIKVIDPQPDKCCRPSCVYRCFDFFHNDRHMKNVGCPAFVMHGQMDEIIPFYHGERLAKAAPAQHRWPGYFPRQAGHNDIVEQDVQAYMREVRAFMQNVLERADADGTRRGVGASSLPAKPPLQVQMTEMSRKDGVLPYAEPKVGPEDGRYEALRHGRGGARELRSAPRGRSGGEE